MDGTTQRVIVLAGHVYGRGILMTSSVIQLPRLH